MAQSQPSISILIIGFLNFQKYINVLESTLHAHLGALLPVFITLVLIRIFRHVATFENNGLLLAFKFQQVKNGRSIPNDWFGNPSRV